MFGRLLLTGILALGMASAQRGGGGGGDDMGMGGMGGGGRAGGGDMGAPNPMSMQRRTTKAEQIADKLKLNKDQKEQFQTILNAARERAGSVRLELDKQRAQIAGALIDGKSSEELNKVVADYAAVAAQMTKVEADAFAKVCALLKPNQQAKADQAFELMAGIFGGASAGRGGSGGGQGRQGGSGMGGGSGRGRGQSR